MYNTSPASWVSAIRFKLRKPLQSPDTPGLARILDESYYARRDPLVQRLVERIRAGENLYDVLQGFRAKNYDERVAEYPYFVSWLLKQEKGSDLLDVGCTLNNKIVSNVLRERCNCVWFCNGVAESTVFISNPIYYHLSDLEHSFPSGNQFSLVTCLSTIEHIGYDNSVFGWTTPGRYTSPAVEPLVKALRRLGQLLAPGGNMLVSFPFGHREVLVHPVTKKIGSQVFDYASLQEGLAAAKSEGVMSEAEVLAATENGWERVDARTCDLRYADGCPASRAVAFIRGSKED